MLTPNDLLEKGFKTIALSFIIFLHYIVTMLVFFVPIDVLHKILDVPQAPAILMGSAILYLWSICSAWALVKSYKGVKSE